MKIRVKLYSFFIFLSGNREGILELETDDVFSVQDLLMKCGVKKDYTALIRVNGLNRNINDTVNLTDGDFVEVFPIFGGG